jgi:hypothetical protein
MEALRELLLDQLGYPPGGPQAGGVSERLRAALQGAFELAPLHGGQSWWAPHARGFLQAGAPARGY